MLPDLDSLALFVRAAELHSLSKAADASHLGAAAASRRLAILEERFKATLFRRTPKGVELTAAGAALLPHAKQMLMQTNAMQSDMADHAAGRRGAVRLLASTSALGQALPEDLATFARLHPDITLVIKERWSADTVKALLGGEADVGIVLQGPPTDGLETCFYRTDRLAVLFPPDHPLAALPRLTYTDVLPHDVIALEGEASMMRLLAEQAVALNRILRMRVQVRGFQVVCRMVQAGFGVGILPHEAVNTLSEGMGLVVRRLDDDWARRTMLLCYRTSSLKDSSVELVVRYLSSSGSATAGRIGPAH